MKLHPGELSFRAVDGLHVVFLLEERVGRHHSKEDLVSHEKELRVLSRIF